jgi:hypothetical protein
MAPAAAVTTTARATSLASVQRHRPKPWVQAKRKVPVSSSASRCDDSTTDTPSSTIAVITVAMKSCRARGSSMAIGSSSTRSCGRLASARVNANWACCPPDILAALRFKGMPNSPSRRVAYCWSNRQFRLRVMWSRSAAERFL